jgi:(S)-2-hydroxyglutarate dehydrogenase
MIYDVAIVGAGVVGLATALQLSQQKPQIKICVLEKERDVAMHQSSHNSGVIHSGIYYTPGSLRAQNCLRGYTLLLDFCQKYDVEYDICGKIIVAVEEEERGQIEKIWHRGLANGMQGLRRIGPEEIREIEPHVRALEGIWVPQTGIIDYWAVAQQYKSLLHQAGVDILTGHEVIEISKHTKSIVIACVAQTIQCRYLVNCAGLYSDKIARMSGEETSLQILPFRGEYYDLIPEKQHLVRNLIYPVPNPAFPFLGVHFTRMIQGGVEAGPNAVLAFRREGYSRYDLNISELYEIIRFPGFQKIAQKYWRMGWEEMKRSYVKAHFVSALQRLIPEITAADLVPGRSGVRAMACDLEGNLSDEFLIFEQARVLNVCNAPSPAATASLAIGETVAGRLLKQMGA